MQFQESVKRCLVQYATFHGRASRSEFWWWTLFVVLASMAGGIINEKIAALVTLGTLLPYLAVTARRLHDINRSGWWQLVGFVPIIGWIIMIYWCVQAPREPNVHGAAAP